MSLNAIQALERAWLRDRAKSSEQLDDTVRSTYEYALRLAATSQITTRDGVRVCIAPHLTDLREQLLVHMSKISQCGWSFPGPEKQHGVGTLAWTGRWCRRQIIEGYPAVARMLHTAISHLNRVCFALDEYSLQDALIQKKLVLALGGGGGTGFVHLCLFQWLEEKNIQPSLITGTSIGGLLGYLRSLQYHYDAALSTIMLPSLWQITKSLRPCIGSGRHGLVGMCRIDLSDIFTEISQAFGWTTAPSFNELRIPFACVASGILQKSPIIPSLESQSRNPVSALLNLTRMTWQNTMRHASHIASLIASQQAVIPTVFGFDELTRVMTAVDATMFSMLVPGVLSYELPRNHYRSREIVDTIFKRDGLYRLADGGMASNVPVRAAREAVMNHKIGHENVYILGVDVFAPQTSDGIFYPLQQIANTNAIVDATYADAFIRLKYLLSPMNLSPSRARMKWLNSRFRHAFSTEMDIISYAMRPLHPLSTLDLGGF